MCSTKLKHPDTPDKLDSVGTKMKFKHPPRKSTSKAEFKSCSRCGKAYHNRDKCPAKDVACHKCQKKCHFSSQCFSKIPAAQHSVDISSLNATHSSDETIIFLDTIQTGSDTAWNITAQVSQHQVPFKLDTGAAVTLGGIYRNPVYQNKYLEANEFCCKKSPLKSTGTVSYLCTRFTCQSSRGEWR